jgi:signal transduction histidine kinase
MLEQVLSFLRVDRRLAPPTLSDIATTLQIIADQFSDMGHSVSYAGPGHVLAVVRPDDLHRGITNLVENAARFGGETTICLSATKERITIDIEDDGGLSIARAIINAHSGELSLRDRQPHGLIVRIELPPSQSARPAA